MSFGAMEDIIKKCKLEKCTFYEAILFEDMKDRKVSKEEAVEKMNDLWNAMFTSSKNYEKNLRSASGLVGGEGGRMEEYYEKHTSLSGDFVSLVVAKALQMGESNACMKRIVAAPTAGSCGVLPAVFVPLHTVKQTPVTKIIEALFVAAGIGQVIASRATISGALGGCQAEIGSASAMAAGALTYLQDGTEEQISHAAAIALKNLLGLVCDPVAGLVEIPCIKRNVIGAVNALTAADMAAAGITSVIPSDQVIDAMKEIGDIMHESLKETGMGGLAATKAAQEIMRKIGKA